MLLLSFSLAVLGIKLKVGALHSIPYPLLIDQDLTMCSRLASALILLGLHVYVTA